jgi:16S rRNA (uracil1498-N3)-methyltransferase
MSTLVRLFVESPLSFGTLITPAPSQSHYLTSVMRLNAGDTVELFNGVDGAWLARLSTLTKKSCTLVCQAQTRAQEQPQDLWLCAAPLKKGRIDWVAEKACELGVANFMPVLTKRSVVDRLNLERLRAHNVGEQACQHSILSKASILC